jgi:hypothetical protein
MKKFKVGDYVKMKVAFIVDTNYPGYGYTGIVTKVLSDGYIFVKWDNHPIKRSWDFSQLEFNEFKSNRQAISLLRRD